MSSELEQAGLPSSFKSTKVIKKSTEKNRKKKAQKRRNKNKNKNKEDFEKDAEVQEFVDHFNYAEEFKVIEVLKEYRNPFTILMAKADRFQPEEYGEYGTEENFECDYGEAFEDRKDHKTVNYQENCELNYDLSTDNQKNQNNTPNIPVTTKKKNDPLQKYYHQRYDYFSLFDEGIQIDEEGWYSVTPEIIADHIAQEVHSIASTNKTDGSASGTVILDAFCGVGGNTIQFAKYFDRVIAVDLDSGRLEMARHNATIYGVADRIQFIHGDVFTVLPELIDEEVDLVFMSPPWGGPDYVSKEIFCPRFDLLNRRGEELFKLARSISPNLILFLPRQTDIYTVAEMVKNEKDAVKKDESLVVEQHWLRNKLKAISIYFYS